MQPNNQAPVTPQTVPNNQVNPGAPQIPPPQFLLHEANKAVTSVKDDYKSPAFWFHVALQLLTWLGYYDATSHTLKIGTLVLSGSSFVAYLLHLAKIKN